MLNSQISKQVLTMGVKYEPPIGGIAQLIESYSKIFRPFRFIPTTYGGKCKILNLICLMWGLLRLLFNSPFIKIVHLHAATNNSFWRKAFLIRILKKFKKRIVLHIHGGSFKQFYATSPQKIKKVLQEVDTVVTLSKSWEEFFVKDIGINNVVVINNIISYPQLCDTVKDGKIHFLFLGGLTHAKGFFDLLNSIIAIKEKVRNKAVFHIGGNGNIEEVKGILENNGVLDLVILHGFVTGIQKTTLLNMCDVFILPSYIEGLPISILEAMSYRCGIVSTTVGGIPDIVDEQNGILIGPGDVVNLSNSILYLIQNKNVLSSMGVESEKKASCFLQTSVEQQLTQLYNSLL